MKHGLRVIVFIVICLVGAGGAVADDGIIRMGDRQEVTFSTMVADLAGADAIFVGEVHNDPVHHRLQLAVMRALYERKAKLAIGLEMFQPESQQFLDDWVAGKMKEEDFQAVYSKNWTFAWSLYRDIFVFARDNKIPMIALNIPKQIASKVARQGFASLTDDEKKALPAGITCELKSAYTDLLKVAFGQVYKQLIKQGSFNNFCESQTLRNRAMAMNIARYRTEHPDRKVVAIAGIWHAVKGGAPANLLDVGKGSIRVVIPEIPELGPQNATRQETDYLVRRQDKTEQ